MSSIFTLDELNSREFEDPTLTYPSIRKSDNNIIKRLAWSQKDFNSQFINIIDESQISNVCYGFLSTEHQKDSHLYVIDVDNKDILWNKVVQVIKYFKHITVSIFGTVSKIILRINDMKTITIHVRLNETIETILVREKVDWIFYCNNTYFTEDSYIANMFQYYIIDFDAYKVLKAFDNDYKIILPNLDISKVNESIDLPFLQIKGIKRDPKDPMKLIVKNLVCSQKEMKLNGFETENPDEFIAFIKGNSNKIIKDKLRQELEKRYRDGLDLTYFEIDTSRQEVSVLRKIKSVVRRLPKFHLDSWLQETKIDHVSVKEWYGTYYTETIDRDIYFRHLFLIKHFCSICQEEDVAPNLIVLDCGHMFHFKNNLCCGLLDYLKRGNRDCPNCREPM